MWALLSSRQYGWLVLWTMSQQAVLALSYDLLGGMGRELHLGHGAFFGVGAYACAVFLHGGLPWWVGVLAAGISGALAAGGLAPLLVELRGVDFALSSLCLALLGGILARILDPLTGGVSGLATPIVEREIPYLGTSILLLGTFWFHDALSHARWGRALRATGIDPVAASHLGVRCRSSRTQALVLGSSLASLAGGIYPLHSGYVSPESAFGLDVLLTPVVAVSMGGPGTRWGPLWGAGVLVAVQELLLTSSPGANLLLLGLFLVFWGLALSRGEDGVGGRPSNSPPRAPRLTP